MRRNGENSAARSGGIPGAATLITVFAVLCMAVFAILALSTATSEKRLSDLALQNTLRCCEADTAAQEWLGALREAGENGTFTGQFPITDTRVLMAEVCIRDGGYDIIRWQQVYAENWEPDDRLNVWDGQ